MDLPVWQDLYEELKDDGYTVLAVAMDSRGVEAVRPWVDQAGPGYDCLIDQQHHVAELYNMVNVPQAVWIDEAGRIVRPAEVAGASDGFRAMNRRDFSIPEAEVVEIAETRAVYLDALRDWVAKGEASEFVLQDDDVRARQKKPDDSVMVANANFRLGQHLHRQGNRAEGLAFLREASRIRPDSWNFWRQMADLEEIGKSGGSDFWARVDALGDDDYYAPIDMPGMPK